MFVEPVGAAIAVVEVIAKERRSIARHLRRLIVLVTKGRMKVAIFGPGGVGKSTLAQFLCGALPVGAPAYTESLVDEKYRLDDLVVDFLVPPGQKRRRISHWPDLFTGLESGKITAVLNTVAWGYHSFAEDEVKLESAQDLQGYLALKRSEELEVLKELRPRLTDAGGNFKMLTVVTKQDLWWERRDEVRRHYMDGPYNDMIQSIAAARGPKCFKHEYVSVSLVMQNFAGREGPVLALTTAGYDQSVQYANQNWFLKHITAIAQR